ncbi:transcription antitermination factor NusB [Flaviflexus equikiangi]|uniref:NusB/RsmB/TIM44 domain-containing protein n=1 Tax=Flaviflexus equikiangi TaxID=2758573 RepID=A0ABS2THQ7_9ACTO|nr:transcription antitermination factor NusB [Flaviflexus equikiangi]MBM9434198.1 hypothetical protein [Flaviflexus equikiangi]
MARKGLTQRKRALDVIFEAEQKDILVPGLLRELLAERQEVSTHQVPIQKLGVDLVDLVADHLYEIDGMIDDYSKFGLRRLSSIDRAVLRLGVGEIYYGGTNVAEAIRDYSEIVRELGNDKSIGFITAVFHRTKESLAGETDADTTGSSAPSGVSADSPLSAGSPAESAESASAVSAESAD